MKYYYKKETDYFNDTYYEISFAYKAVLYGLILSSDTLVISTSNGDFKRLTVYERGITFEYVYKFNKRSLSVQSIERYIDHIVYCLSNDFAIDAWIIEPLKKAL